VTSSKRRRAGAGITILVDAAPWRKTSGIEKKIFSAALLALAAERQSAAEINILLSDDKHVKALNSQFRGLNKPTNVLSFPSGDDALGAKNSLGDVILGFETIARESDEHGKPFVHHAQHLTMHGVLHLLGFDHEREDEAKVMEALETKLCRRLGIADPYNEADAGN